MSKKRLDSTKVLEWAKKKKSFTTAQVQDTFKVTKMQAAAGIAILRIKEVVEPASPPKTDTGVSRWVYTG